MSKICYDKLIRDKIPQIIESSGKKYVTRVLDDETYLNKLVEKLGEELKEFEVEFERENDENAIKELADMSEVIYAIVEAIGVSKESFERIREAKRSTNGGFERKLLLVEVE